MIKGSHHTEEAIKKMRGNTNCLGKHHSEKTKRKISEANKGKMFSEEHKRNISEACSEGGIGHDGNGYLLFKVPKGCKFSCMRGRKGYVFIHRLVMAAYLQRALTDKEVVHHRNGKVDDNRIENLRLFESTGEHTSLHHKFKISKYKGGE